MKNQNFCYQNAKDMQNARFFTVERRQRLDIGNLRSRYDINLPTLRCNIARYICLLRATTFAHLTRLLMFLILKFMICSRIHVS
jgi:hypothetical protein